MSYLTWNVELDVKVGEKATVDRDNGIAIWGDGQGRDAWGWGSGTGLAAPSIVGSKLSVVGGVGTSTEYMMAVRYKAGSRDLNWAGPVQPVPSGIHSD